MKVIILIMCLVLLAGCNKDEATVNTGSGGVAGPAGPTGPTGEAGVVGLQGEQGIQGPQGIQGLTGATGAAGSQGLTGATGSNGQTGAIGPQGLAGATGAKGVIAKITQINTQGVCIHLGDSIYVENEGDHADLYNNSTCDYSPNPKKKYCDNMKTESNNLESIACRVGLRVFTIQKTYGSMEIFELDYR